MRARYYPFPVAPGSEFRADVLLAAVERYIGPHALADINTSEQMVWGMLFNAIHGTTGAPHNTFTANMVITSIARRLDPTIAHEDLPVEALVRVIARTVLTSSVGAD